MIKGTPGGLAALRTLFSARALHLLTGHPHVLAALRGEADAVLGREVATWEDLPRLELTARVIHEALRLFPPAWVTLRTPVREARLAGRVVPAGSLLIFSPFPVHLSQR